MDMRGMANSDTREHRFPNAAALTEALAVEIAGSLQTGLAAVGGASLVVPGGRSPIALFERLSDAELDWDDVWVSLTDERWVDATSPSSNEKLVREHLLHGLAAAANFVGLKTPA